MYMTNNYTTTQVGQSRATVVAHTVHPSTKQEITTWELVYPRYIHSEFMTHRMFSRNASSSRATPVKTLIAEVEAHPVYFDEVRCNQKGMTGGELVTSSVEKQFRDLWMQGAAEAAKIARQMADLGVAKQTVNRLLEPYLPIRVLMTATEVENFFKLRLAPDAQPEIQSLAKAMKGALAKAPFPSDSLHAPYLESFSMEDSVGKALVRSIAACARVSILRGDGKQTTYEDDLALVKRLRKGGHMTPFEHVAFAQEYGQYANFKDWASARYFLERKKPMPFWDELTELLKVEE